MEKGNTKMSELTYKKANFYDNAALISSSVALS